MFVEIKRIFKSSSLPEKDENFDHYLADVTKIFKIYGLHSWSADWKLQNACRLIFPVVIMLLYAVVFEAHYLSHYRDNADLLLLSLLVTFGSETLLVKLFVIFLNRKNFREIVGTIRNDFWSNEDDVGLEKMKILTEGSRVMKLLMKTYSNLMSVVIILLISWPIISNVYYGRHDTPLKFPLPGEIIFALLQNSIK